jgi:diguanylate cyclase (GGDEF)-like protein
MEEKMGTLLCRDIKQYPTHLVAELEYYRRHNEYLRMVNDLYREIAGRGNLPSLLEAYSNWVIKFAPLALVGYKYHGVGQVNPFFHKHGPDRREVMELTQGIMSELDDSSTRTFQFGGYHARAWALKGRERGCTLIFLKQGQSITNSESLLVESSLGIIEGPIKQVLEYEEIYQQARRDFLTGLPNRRVFEEQIHLMIKLAGRHNHPLTVALLDLDRFKQINDTMGHLEGDEVLKKVAELLSKRIRKSDLLVRLGGDEFVLVLPETDVDASRVLCERICCAVKKMKIRDDRGKLGVSIGLAQWRPGMNLEQVLARADDMLYRVKAEGGCAVAS